MNILFLEAQPCIRALKYAEGLKSVGSEVKLFFAYTRKTLTQFYGYGDELFEMMIKLKPEELPQQINALFDWKNIDLVHSHNAPDFLTVSAIEASRGRIPIIHDIHDLISIRNTPYGSLDPRDSYILEIERRAVTKCDGLIYVTSGVKEACESAYPLGQKPRIVFPNYVPRRLMPSTLRRKLSKDDGKIHLVYEGGLDSLNLGSHYDLKDIFKAIADQGIHIHIYSSIENPDYSAFAEGNDYIHYQGHLDAKELFSEITQYDYGWAGFNITRNKKHVDTVLANKVLEYIGCGLPVISLNHETQRKFIEENGIGVVITKMDQLSSRLQEESELNEVRRRVLECRDQFTIESKINAVLNFYKSLTD